MNVLVVVTHPVRKSFNHALLARVEAGLAQAGHNVKVADLCAEGFQSAMTEEDFGQFRNEPPPLDVQKEQDRVAWSDAIVFVFPLWWWSVPGILKGWIDRVMTYGWAWTDPAAPEKSPMRARKVLVLVTAGASAEALAKRGYDTALETQLNVGTWSYMGFKDVTTRIFYDVHHETGDTLRSRCLDEAEALAAAL